MRTFTDFTPDNDPYGEHDFGSFELANHKFFWKIDYYDKTMTYGSEDPADPEQHHAGVDRHACGGLLRRQSRPLPPGSGLLLPEEIVAN